MVKGRNLDPKWLGPYKVIRKVTDLVYGIQMGNREVNVHVEQLKLCRTSREELRLRRKQNRQRMRVQKPRYEREEESDPDEDGSEADAEKLLGAYERQIVNDSNCKRNENTPGGER
jgi:hypothetical protein